MPSNETAEITEQIQRYLSNHPNAADSIEGITAWWLSVPGCTEINSMVQAALDELVENKKIIKTINGSGKVVYKNCQPE